MIDTSIWVGRMLVHILGAVTDFEHPLMAEGARDGLTAAGARAGTAGQSPGLRPSKP